MNLKLTDDLTTGNELIDQQHKDIVNCIDKLVRASRQGRSKTEVAAAIAEFEKYISEHFRDEEQLQVDTSYPGIEAHKAHHDQFRRSFEEFKRKSEKIGISHSLVIQLLSMATDWFNFHINEMDRALAAYLRENNRPGSITVPGEKTPAKS